MPAEKPDMHIIGIIDDEMDRHGKFKTLIKREGEGKIMEADQSLTDLLYSLEMQEGLKDASGCKESIALGMDNIKRHRKKAEKNMGKKGVDEIINCRAKIHLLMDSPGGSKIIGDQYSSLMKRARKNNSGTNAYVTREASSMACNLLFEAEKGYAMKDSFILWHLGRVDDDIFNPPLQEENEPTDPEESATEMESGFNFDADELQAEFDNENWEIFTAMMNDKCKSTKRKRMQKKLDASFNGARKEVIFSGKELADYGVIAGAFDSTRKLFEKFCEETGIEPDLDKDKTAIGKFFRFARMAEQVSKNAGIHCSLRYDQEYHAIKFRIINDEEDTPENKKKVREALGDVLESGKKK